MLIFQELSGKQKRILTLSSVVAAIVVVVILCLYLQPHQYPKELASIDSLSESRPDSALKLLKRLPERSLENDADRMYYALLKIKTANNLYEPQKDSTIFRVCDFFEESRDKDKYRESCYYLGKYYVEHSDAPQALKCFQTALDLSDESTPLSFKSKVYSQSGTLFLEQDMFDEALQNYKKSYSLDSVLHDTVNMIHGLRDIGQVYRHIDKSDSCAFFLEKASAFASTLGDKYLEHTVSLSLISMYLKEKKLLSALKLLRHTLPYVDKKTASPAFSVAMTVYSRLNVEDSAFVYGKRLLSVGTIYAKEQSLSFMMDYYSKRNDLANVMNCLKRYREVSDSIRSESSVDAVAKIHALYNYSLRERENTMLLEENRKKTYYCAFFVFLLVLVCFVFALFRIKSKSKYASLTSLYEHLGQMYDSVREQNEVQSILKDRKISDLTLQLELLGSRKSVEIESYKKTINELSKALQDAVLNSDQRKTMKLDVYEKIRKRLMERKYIPSKAWKDIEISFDYIYPHFKENIYDRCGLDDYEYRICILSKLGFLNSEIAILLSRTQGAITQMRTNLYKKLSGFTGSAKQFDAYIRSL